MNLDIRKKKHIEDLIEQLERQLYDLRLELKQYEDMLGLR